MACGVYVGYDDPKTLGRGEGGSSTALPIFANFMDAYHKDLPVSDFIRPESVVEVKIDSATGLLPSSDQNTRTEVFISGTEPTEMAPAPDENSAQNWMMRQIGTANTEEITDDAGSEDEF